MHQQNVDFTDLEIFSCFRQRPAYVRYAFIVATELVCYGDDKGDADNSTKHLGIVPYPEAQIPENVQHTAQYIFYVVTRWSVFRNFAGFNINVEFNFITTIHLLSVLYGLDASIDS